MSFDTQITEVNSTELDSLFQNVPTSNPTANDLIIGKDDTTVHVNGTTDVNIPELTDDMFDAGEEEAEKEEVDKSEIVEEKKKPKEKKEEPVEVDNSEVKAVLKNTIDYLVSQGLWSDFEGRDELDISQETYADLAAKQAQFSAYKIVDELIDSTGSYGKAIISHIKAGGNPDEIIDLFKEQKELSQIDVSTEDGKQIKIEKYYKDILGWKPDKVKKHLNRLLEDNDIDSEFEDVEELYNKHYESKLLEKEEKTKEEERKKAERQTVFVNHIKSALDDDLTLTDRDRKLISSSILDFKHNIGNGQKVSDFYIKFAEMQNDPKEYIKLVRYVMDRETFEKKLREQEKTKAANETFNFIKGNAAVSKSKTANIEIANNNNQTTRQNSYRGTDFSFVLKK